MRDPLAARGIFLRHYEPGEHRAACPWCARGPRDDALAVRIDQGGACWCCHRCGEQGGLRSAGVDRARAYAAPPKPPWSYPERHNTLSSWGRALWNAAQQIEPGTVAADYLEGRGCLLPPDHSHLRWHPAHADLVSGYTGPALVALVTNAETGEPINLHRTWLAQDGSGKAPIARPRRLLKGHSSRGVVRLWPDAEVIDGLVVGEGVETCLAGANCGLTPCWSTLSASNLASLPLLPGIEGLTVLVDHDKPNPKTGKRAGHDAARALVNRYVAAGFDPNRDIVIFLPSGEGLDVADLVRNAP